MPFKAPSLADVVSRLEAFYGAPEPPGVTDPFEMIVAENASYLVDDDRRARVLAKLRDKVGLDPEEILDTPTPVLSEVIRDGGMLPEHRVEKLVRAANLALEIGLDHLRQLVRTDPPKAAKLLKKFPGIGEPGADKLLLFSRAKRTLAPDSNALRVLVRLGFGKEDENYSRQYRSVAEAVEPHLPKDYPRLISAHQLLRRHGQEICRRGAPLCETCPLTKICPWFLERQAWAGK
jgi:endonuclease III